MNKTNLNTRNHISTALAILALLITTTVFFNGCSVNDFTNKKDDLAKAVLVCAGEHNFTDAKWQIDSESCPVCGNNPCLYLYASENEGEENDGLVYCYGCGNRHSPENCPWDDVYYQCSKCSEEFDPDYGHTCYVDYDHYCSYCGTGVGFGEGHRCDVMDGGDLYPECPRCGAVGYDCCSEEDYIEGYCHYCGTGIPFGGGHYCDAMAGGDC